MCFVDQHQLEIRWASTLRAMEWTGYTFGDRQVRLWHQTIGMSWIQIIKEKIDAWFNRRMFIPAYEMTTGDLDEIFDKIRAHAPTLIDGYAESFHFLAQNLDKKKVEGINPKGIISSAQELTEESRIAIEKAFGCPVYDKYGSREFSGIAYECSEHDGHHVSAESYIVEILKDGKPAKPGEMGEIVITDLNNFCMPFIRYRIGDLAVASDNSKKCACGRGLPRIGKIMGRVQSIISCANGKYLPGTFFAHFFKDYSHLVRHYQVVQEKDEEFTLKIVQGGVFEQKQFDELILLLRKYVGTNTKIEIEFVDEIPLVRTGKRQGCISHVKRDYQSIGDSLVSEQERL